MLSTRKYEKHLIAAKAGGMITGMIYVCLESVELAIKRVKIRAMMGGHSVSDEKITARWFRSLENAGYFLKNHIDVGYVLSNSHPDGISRIIATTQAGKISIIDDIELIHLSMAAPDLFHQDNH